MSIEINNNKVKIPEKNRPGRKNIYPFDTMEIGSSFYIQKNPDESLQTLFIRLCNAANYHRKKYKKYFQIRKLESETGVGVWRVK